MLLVVGLDGATWKILKPLLKRGKLPYLKKLVGEGVSGNLESTLPPMTAPAWASFQTGVSPGEHGVFDFVDYRHGSWGEKLFNPAAIPGNRFWDILEEKGRSFCLLNMPLTYPPRKKKKGLIVSSLFTPPGASFASDKKVQKELEKIGYVVEIKFEEHGEDFSNKGKIYRQALETAKKRFEAAQFLAKKRKWDYFFVLFRTPDLIQHFFWDGEKTEKYYQKLDGYLEKLHLLFKKRYRKVDFIILSDHGFHQAAPYQFSINTWLQQTTDREQVPDSSWKKARSLYQELKKWGITKERFAFLRKLAKKGLKEERKALFEFRKKSSVWAFRFGIFINRENLKEDYEKTRNSLVKKLVGLKYRGKLVFKLVKKREDVYQGQKLKEAPDIAFISTKDFNVDAISFSPQVFTRRANFDLKGEHFLDRVGIFIANGPSFAKKKKKADYKIWEMASLTLKVLGIKAAPLTLKESKDLKKKIEKSEKVIKKALKRFKNECGLAWTGGKDSMVMLDMVRRIAGKNLPPVMFIDHQLHFKETYEFVGKMKKKWGLDLIVATDKGTLKKIKEEKNLKKKREIARVFKIKCIEKTVKDKKWKALFAAIRWDEHPARSQEKHFSSRDDHTRIHPVLHFTEKDIWAYIKKFNLPSNPLYDKGYRSLGEAPFTKPVKDKSLPERAGREKDKEKIMERLRALGYF